MLFLLLYFNGWERWGNKGYFYRWGWVICIKKIMWCNTSMQNEKLFPTLWFINYIIRMLWKILTFNPNFQYQYWGIQLLFSFIEKRKWLRNMARNFTNTSYEIRCGVSFCKTYLNKQLSLTPMTIISKYLFFSVLSISQNTKNVLIGNFWNLFQNKCNIIRYP